MAEEDLQGTEGGKKKSKLLLIIIIVLVLLGGGGAGAYFFLLSPDNSESEEMATDAPEAEASMPSNESVAIYVAMPRPFQFNSPGITRERIVQIEVQLMVRGLDNEERAKRHIPMIEGALLRVFSASNADDLVTDVGKVELRKKATSQVQQVMTELEKTPVIEEVLFTGFVIQ